MTRPWRLFVTMCAGAMAACLGCLAGSAFGVELHFINGVDSRYVQTKDTAPPVEKFATVLSNPKARGAFIKWLPRYTSRKLTPVTLEIIAEGSTLDRTFAIAGLIHQADDSEPARRVMREQLLHRAGNVREVAGEYFARFGQSDDLAELRAAARKTRDLYTRASIDAAIVAVERRERIWRALPDGDEDVAAGPPGSAGGDPCDVALAALRNTPSRRAWREAWEVYRGSARAAPIFRRAKTPGRSVDPAIGHRAALANALFGCPAIPWVRALTLGDTTKEMSRPATPAKAELFSPPVRSYLVGRDSYGFKTDPKGIFGGKIHVGDDCAWFRPHATVCAAADGIVRTARHMPEWGGLVVLAHTMADGKVGHTVYGHLSPFFHVAVGQVVRSGQKIGSVARSYTWDNGGYGAHLHFGIHIEIGGCRPLFPVRNPTGYVSKEKFADQSNGWVDPQVYVRSHMHRGSPARQVATSGPGKARARLNLAKSYLSVDMKGKAVVILIEVADAHKGTPEGAEALTLLKSLRK